MAKVRSASDRSLASMSLYDIRALFKYRELLISWTMREVSVRYKQAALGVAWAVLQPLCLMAIFSVVFGRFIPVDTDGIPYPIFSFVALLPWVCFATALTTGTTSIINNLSLVTKVQFPREILPLAHVGAAWFDCAVGAALCAIALVAYRSPLSWSLLVIPWLAVLQVMLTSGLVLIASAATVRYRDVRFVVPLAIQVWLYATPIIYPASAIPAASQWIFHLNPMAVIIDGYRQAVLYARSPTLQDVALATMVSTAVLLVGYSYFKRTEIWFADII